MLQVISSFFMFSGTLKLMVTPSLSWDHLYTGGDEFFDAFSSFPTSVSLNFRTGGFSSSSSDVADNREQDKREQEKITFKITFKNKLNY